ncbi:Tfp pilus assembly protein PilF [Luteimonas cucumeris]|uniref:Tfp pilus assembly protein PilF n=1 Tax=Luteimonas cucumeris TaxID=985012 RepID=A0A562LAL7_9GAMM|nr:transglutaminase-like domain-containing protein [Luteimonas cucumeris]TWI04606.1 Tfp pilus assembly protein PilF [Luteimonas cucumeris]
MNWAAAALLAVATLDPGPGLPSRDQIMAVPPELHAQFQEQVIRKGDSTDERLRLLIDFVLNDPELQLEYDNNLTRTISETYRTRKANCLSFTLLFSALAREAGIKTQIQEYEQVLVWYQNNGLVFNSSHVNVLVKRGGTRQIVDVGRNVLISRYRPRPIPEQRAIAFFYNNRGVELMAQNQLAAARQHLDAAIELAPTHAASWSNRGVLELRMGNALAAERAYRKALELDSRHGAALANIVTLYQRSGQDDLANRYLRRLQRVQLDDPFHQFMLAMDFEKRGEYGHAVPYYRRAIRLHGEEPAFHMGLARSYSALGDVRRARRELSRAENLKDENTRRALHAKNEERRQRAGSVAQQVSR